MSKLKWALIGLLALPAAELAGFLLVAILIGWLWATVALVSTFGFQKASRSVTSAWRFARIG